MIFRGTSQKECSGLQKGFPVESWLIGGGFRAFVVPLHPSLPPFRPPKNPRPRLVTRQFEEFFTSQKNEHRHDF